jgi:hypothetical protein
MVRTDTFSNNNRHFLLAQKDSCNFHNPAARTNWHGRVICYDSRKSCENHGS